MRFSNVAFLTLAALASQNLTATAHPVDDSHPPSDQDISQGSHFSDRADAVAPAPIESVSEPETLSSQQFSPRNHLGRSPGLLVATANLAQLPAPVPMTPIAATAPSQDQLGQLLNETWLAKLVAISSDRSPQQIALRSASVSDSDYTFSNTITLLNALLIVATMLPTVTIVFFWLVRRLVVRELVTEVNQKFKDIGSLEKEIKNSSQVSHQLRAELELQVNSARQTLEFLTKEAQISKASVDQIETLKSQFLMHLQVLINEAYQAKYQIVQEMSQMPTAITQTVPKPEPQPETVPGKQSNVVPFPKNQPNVMADDYLKQGEALYLQGRYEEAVIFFEQAILMNNDLDRAWYSRGNVLVKLQRTEEAVACYDQAIAINPDKYEPWYNRGNALVKLQRYEEAIASYERVLALKPEDSGAWHNRGAILGRLQRYEEAVACYDRVLALKPEDPEVWHNRGAMLGRLQRYAEAVTSYDRALALKPDRYETWYNRGNMLWKLQYYPEAIASYDQAVAISPDKYEAWYNRGAVMGRLQQYAEALASYDRALALKSDDCEVWHNRGVALAKVQRHEEAIASYHQALALKPDCYESWFGKGEALANLQRYGEAIAAYDQAIAIKPDAYDAWRHRGMALSELKHYEEAIASYDRAIAIKPDNAEAWRYREVLLSELKQDTEVTALSQTASIQENSAPTTKSTHSSESNHQETLSAASM